jgi:hypothetical protein
LRFRRTVAKLTRYCGIDTIRSSGLHSYMNKSNLDPDQFFPGFFYSCLNEGRRILSYYPAIHVPMFPECCSMFPECCSMFLGCCSMFPTPSGSGFLSKKRKGTAGGESFPMFPECCSMFPACCPMFLGCCSMFPECCSMFLGCCSMFPECSCCLKADSVHRWVVNSSETGLIH